MPPPASPATTLRRLTVTNDQRRIEWRAGRATIVHGRIVIPADAVPDGFLGDARTTYTIVAVDGGGRVRRFDGVKLDPAGTIPGKKYVFA